MEGEYPQAYSYKFRKARKSHKCYECHGIIPIGELYHYHSGIWGHEAFSFKICDDCKKLTKELGATLPSDSDNILFGDLQEYISESNDPKFIGKFLDNQVRRQGKPHDWLIEKQQNLLDKIDRLELEGIQYDESQDVPF